MYLAPCLNVILENEIIVHLIHHWLHHSEITDTDNDQLPIRLLVPH